MDQSLVDSFPWLFAATHVLHRHLAPRHPPLALCSLGYFFVLDARARSAVLNQRARTRAADERSAGTGLGRRRPRALVDSGAALPRGRGRSGLTAGGRVLPQNGTVMPDAAGPGGATCARKRRGVGVVDGPISQRST